MKILVVEDELRLAEALSQIMQEQKYQVDVANDGNDGLDYALYGDYDVIVLDVMLPGKDGFEVVRALRAAKVQTPVIMLTARDDVRDKIRGLDKGADDYMTKPFVPEELLARIRALSRRQGEWRRSPWRILPYHFPPTILSAVRKASTSPLRNSRS